MSRSKKSRGSPRQIVLRMDQDFADYFNRLSEIAGESKNNIIKEGLDIYRGMERAKNIEVEESDYYDDDLYDYEDDFW